MVILCYSACIPWATLLLDVYACMHVYGNCALLTLEEKASFLDRAVANDFLLFLEHDAENELISLEQTAKGVRCKESFLFDNYFQS